MNNINIKNIVRPLLDWYKDNARTLPWRENPEVYSVWVSEIMLQQTRVAAVVDYYNRFVANFPDVFSLAAASEDEVLKQWEGLGYYNRARNLYKTARIVANERSGVFPQTLEEWLKLPGIGRYTAGAVMSIAFGQPYPAVDGNVLRVLARLLASSEDVTTHKARKEAEKTIEPIIPREDTSSFTQGMIELGALVCLPTNPICGTCPLSAHCLAYKKELQHKLPVRAKQNKRRKLNKTMLIITHNNKLAIQQRASTGLLANMWGLPAISGKKSEQEIVQWLKEHGVPYDDVQPLFASKHVFSHVEWHMQGYHMHVKRELERWTWADKGEITSTYAVPTAYKSYMDWFLQQEEQSLCK